MNFESPTHGKVDHDKLREIISHYMSQDKKGKYDIIVGSDSQKIKDNAYDFVTALIIHHVGHGGIYFWRRTMQDKKISL
ncbi:MAG: ribonuclease H-like YkuK family protein, partial [Patescibacteria group bacterium]